MKFEDDEDEGIMFGVNMGALAGCLMYCRYLVKQRFHPGFS
jgi:hypothetical protein